MKKEQYDYIPMNRCINGGLYLLDSRNLTVGIYQKLDCSFIGIRTKFRSRFLDLELHFDKCTKYGTAKPLKLLEQSPFKDLKNHEYYSMIFNYIDEQLSKLYIKTMTGKSEEEIRNKEVDFLNSNNLSNEDIIHRHQWGNETICSELICYKK